MVRKEKEGQKIQEIWQRFAQEIYREKRFKGYEKERWKIWKEEQKRQKIWWTRRKEIQREKSRKERQEKEVLNTNIIIKLMVILSLLLIDHQIIENKWIDKQKFSIIRMFSSIIIVIIIIITIIIILFLSIYYLFISLSNIIISNHHYHQKFHPR